MNLHILLAGTLFPADLPIAFVNDLLRSARLPVLQTLLARATVTTQSFDETQIERQMPYEVRLLEHHLGQQGTQSNPIAALTALARLDGIELAADQSWALLTPVHFAIGQNGIQLASELPALEPESAQALLESIRPALQAAGLTVLLGAPQRWYVSGEWLADLQTSSLMRAAGQLVAEHLPRAASAAVNSANSAMVRLPQDEPARRWRHLQNEIQMLWHDHPVNQNRQQKGILPVNSIWISSLKCVNIGSQKIPYHSINHVSNKTSIDTAILSNTFGQQLAAAQGQPMGMGPLHFNDWLHQQAGLWAERQNGQLAIQSAAASNNSHLNQLIGLAALHRPMLEEDWGSWIAGLEQLEQNWLAPAQAALMGQRLDHPLRQITLTLCGPQQTRQIVCRKNDRLRFWRHNNLSHLFQEIKPTSSQHV